jgi:fatty acid-binding protein DegV
MKTGKWRSAVNQVQLITDGTAYLSAARLRDLGIISLPIVAQAGDRTFVYDQQTDGHVELLRELARDRVPVNIVGPSRMISERCLGARFTTRTRCW